MSAPPSVAFLKVGRLLRSFPRLAGAPVANFVLRSSACGRPGWPAGSTCLSTPPSSNPGVLSQARPRALTAWSPVLLPGRGAPSREVCGAHLTAGIPQRPTCMHCQQCGPAVTELLIHGGEPVIMLVLTLAYACRRVRCSSCTTLQGMQSAFGNGVRERSPSNALLLSWTGTAAFMLLTHGVICSSCGQPGWPADSSFFLPCQHATAVSGQTQTPGRPTKSCTGMKAVHTWHCRYTPAPPQFRG